MLKHEANLGGEQSGHLIFFDHNTTGDGLVSAFQVLRIMIETDSKFSDLASIVKRYPQACVNVKVAFETPFGNLKEVQRSDRASGKAVGMISGGSLCAIQGLRIFAASWWKGQNISRCIQMAQSDCQRIHKEIGK